VRWNSLEEKGPCVYCKALIDASAIERHDSLQVYHVRVTAEGGIDYYRCHTCGSRLSREHKTNGAGKGWRLL
jgi:DNA-directed RNA polymerase subunit RPC12/RpoP